MANSDGQLRVVMLGPPASGKGTQGRLIASEFAVSYLSTGSLLRQQVSLGTRLGAIAAPILEQGRYLPDGVMCEVVDEWLTLHPLGWVLDGFPRSADQAEYLDRRLADDGLVLDAAIALSAPRELLWQRVSNRLECPSCRWSGASVAADHSRCPSCGHTVDVRPDDHRENFLSRYAEFERHTLPAMAYYRRNHRLIEVDASGDPASVTAEIRAQLCKLVGLVEA